MRLKIPAKALLFGEYGVLSGGKALVCLLSNLFFDIEINIHAHINNPDHDDTKNTHITIKSTFFKNGVCEFDLHANSTDRSITNTSQESEHNQEKTFFENTLIPWIETLKNHNIEIVIHQSFPPDLGFGSSSALITALCYALFVHMYGYHPKITDEQLWKKIRETLHCVQGTASGYDVGVQLAHVIESHKNTSNIQSQSVKKSFWIYQNQHETIVPQITPWQILNEQTDLSWLGGFVRTNVYSDTKKVLKSFSKFSAQEKSFFMTQHANIAEQFLKCPNQKTLITCMNQSVELAKQQNIFCGMKSLPFREWKNT